jgi:hypothetical protein
MATQDNGWDVNERGNVTFTPLYRFLGMTAPQGFGVVRLEVLTDPHALQTPGAAYQIALTPQQAVELGEALLRMADQISAMPSTPR